MKPGRTLLVFGAAVFLGGALLAPWLYWLVQWGAEHFASLRSLAGNPFHRFVHRALLGLALVGIWPLTRAFGLASWSDLGWVRPQGQGRRLLLGLGLGVASLALLVGLALLAGAREIKPGLQAAAVGSKLLAAAATAGVVAVLEETFFRGALMGGLRRSGPPGLAIFLSSAIYALVHFFQKPLPPESVHWFTGLLALGQMMRGFVDWTALVPGFLTLLLAGLILGLAFQRSGNLFFSVGLHAGWIFWLKFTGAATFLRPEANSWFWGSARLIDGWLAVATLAGVLGLVLYLPELGPARNDAGKAHPSS
jgi:uncharacterized protein